MNDQTSPPQESNITLVPVKKRPSVIRAIIAIIAVLVITGAVGYGVYIWQQNESIKQRSDLQSQINALKKSTVKEPVSVITEASTYQSKVGALTLKLSTPYVTIVNVDGNKGGAPGTTLRIGQKNTDGSIIDNVYMWTQIEIGVINSSVSLATSAQAEATSLKNDGFEDIVISDVKVSMYNAKLITANGFSYDGNRRIYVINSGDYVYTITGDVQDISKDSTVLTAVLNGVTIKEAKFN